MQTIIRLHRMHDMQTIVTDVRGVCQSVCPSVCRSRGLTRLYCAGIIRCSLCQITFAFCFVSSQLYLALPYISKISNI